MPGLLTLAVAIGGLTAFWSTRYTELLNESFEADVQLTNSFVLPALAISVWDYEVARTENTLSGMAEAPAFLTAEVVVDGETFAQFDAKAFPSDAPADPFAALRAGLDGQIRANWADTVVLVATPILREGGEQVGRLLAAYSKTEIERLTAQAYRLAFSIAFGAFAAFAAVLIAVARSITRPIGRIVEGIDALQSGQTAFAVVEATRRDEIGRLGRSLERFRDAVRRNEDLEREKECERRARLEAQAEKERQSRDREAAEAKAAAAEQERREAERMAMAAREVERERHLQEQKFVMAELSACLHALASGALDQTCDVPFPDPYDNLRQDLNETIGRLRGIISAGLSEMDDVQVGSEEAAQATTALSRRADAQSSALSEASKALNEATEMARACAIHADRSRERAEEGRRRADASARLADRAAALMRVVEEKASDIAAITGTIGAIAFQTSILSINAAIEAARSGPNGQGFAVVAGEVKRLASQTAEAAERIEEITQGALARAQENVLLNDEVRKALQALGATSTTIADDAGTVASQIEDTARTIEARTVEITGLADEAQRDASALTSTATGIRKHAVAAAALQDRMGFFCPSKNVTGLYVDTERVDQEAS